jgi:septal ring factor EnvC (AmiA/AmiB activator)
VNGNGEDYGGRLRRVEEFVEVLANVQIEFAAQHKQLLTAQIVLTDNVDKLAQRMDELAQAQKRTDEQLAHTDEQLAHTDERLSILIRMMDGWIRRQR